MAKQTRVSRWIDYLMENLDIAFAVFVFTITTLLQSFGQLPAAALPVAILLVLGPFLIFQMRTWKKAGSALEGLDERLDRQERATERLTAYFGTGESCGEVQVIFGEADFYSALAHELERSGSKQVDVTYFSPDPPNPNNKGAADYWAKMEERLRADEISVRRIVTIENPAKAQWVRRMTAELAGVPGFSVAVLEHCETQGDLLNLIIFDTGRVFLFGPHQSDRRTRQYLGLMSNQARTVFQEYFDSVWDRLGPQRRVMRGGNVNTDLLDRLDEQHVA